MDNVLIDDRRIHVDFSQSVAKVKFQKQGNTNRTMYIGQSKRRTILCIWLIDPFQFVLQNTEWTVLIIYFLFFSFNIA